MIAVWTCRILGVLFVAAGAMTFVAGDAGDFAHNSLHLVSGLAALGFGFAGTAPARWFALAFGGAYLAFGVLGLLIGEPWHLGPIHLMLGDNVFHVVLGAVVLNAGLLSLRRQKSRRIAERGVRA